MIAINVHLIVVTERYAAQPTLVPTIVLRGIMSLLDEPVASKAIEQSTLWGHTTIFTQHRSNSCLKRSLERPADKIDQALVSASSVFRASSENFFPRRWNHGRLRHLDPSLQRQCTQCTQSTPKRDERKLIPRQTSGRLLPLNRHGTIGRPHHPHRGVARPALRSQHKSCRGPASPHSSWPCRSATATTHATTAATTTSCWPAGYSRAATTPLRLRPCRTWRPTGAFRPAAATAIRAPRG